MILIGMYDSPFVRRVAVSLQLLEIKYEHKSWSVGRSPPRSSITSTTVSAAREPCCR